MLRNGLLRLLLLLSFILVALPTLSETSQAGSTAAQYVFVEHDDNNLSDIIAGVNCTKTSVFSDIRQRAQWSLVDVRILIPDSVEIVAAVFSDQRTPWLQFSPPFATRSALLKSTNLLYQQLSIADERSFSIKTSIL
ncbi:hypothetical protein HHX48_07785 [Salinimonas sp. HHU 13199]|uniref:Uncharacterized protein n=1 Tax=Salinimonas profundi TaxID=2729140 RepID=A0ABR8LHB8_9ALTE|nr:hypothetical protein [Salinimonas profundi]MBD3585629.1 hypothetical protein [Salinimonas profundi]